MNGRDKTDHNLHKRAKCVEAITLPHDWPGDIDFLDVWRAGNKNNGYAYGLTTFSGEGTFRFEPFAMFGQMLPHDSFLQVHGGVELPSEPNLAAKEAYLRTAVGTTLAQDRGFGGSAGRSDRWDRFEGTVEYVDARRGTFEVRDNRQRLVVISVAFNAPRPVADRFNRLREGDYVRIEGRFVNQDRFELESFL